jgi:hypothetical protein
VGLQRLCRVAPPAPAQQLELGECAELRREQFDLERRLDQRATER